MKLEQPAFLRIVVLMLVLITGFGCGGSSAKLATAGSYPMGPTAADSTTLPATLETTTSTVVSVAATWPDASAPRTLFVARADGIFEVSVATGRPLRKLTAIPRGYSPAWVKADRKHGRVFFGLESCDPEPEGTWVVPLAGGRPRFVTNGDEISFSPNGRLIAFPRIEDGCAAGALVVRDLVTGIEKVWHPSTGDVGSVAWAPDGRHIAFSSSAPDPDVRLLDTAVPEPADRKSSSPEPILVKTGALKDAAVVGSRWILLVAEPCPPQPAPGDRCPATIRLIDGSNGQVLTTLPTLTGWDAVALDDAGQAVLLGNATDGVLARYGLRSEVTIGGAVAGDW
ncbi:MAG: hypothetical protein LC792_00125 [Actinobacteria bacterium]|nr:hypothetical protein [Actinomycetota bacterium]